MRRLLFDPHVKLALISAVYTLLLLLVIPKIPVNLTYKFVKINSYVGGYRFTFLGKDFDFSIFKKGMEFGGGIKMNFQVPMDGIAKTKDTINRRLKFLKIYEYTVSSSVSDAQGIVKLAIPHVENKDFAESFLAQRGFLTFKELSEEVEWNKDDFAEYFYNTSYWKDTGLDSTQIQSIVVLGNTKESDSSQFQINLTSEGQSIFSDVAKRNVGKPVALYLDDMPYPISMPLIGEDLALASKVNPVFTSSLNLDGTKVFVNQVNYGFYPSNYQFLGSEEFPPIYSEFSTRAFVLATTLGFMVAFFLVFLVYKRLAFAFVPSLFIQFLSQLFLLKLFSVYVTFEVILATLLSMTLYFVFGLLVLSQADESLRKSAFLTIYITDAFRNSAKIVKPYFVALSFGVLLFYIVREIKDISLLLDLIFGYVSAYVALLTFKLFANLIWKKNK